MSETPRAVFEALLEACMTAKTLYGGTVEQDRREHAEWLARYDAAGWISVDERLPEVGVSVLMWVERKRVSSCEFGRLDSDGTWSTYEIDGEVGRYCLPGEERVTHWMPLPPAPGDELDELLALIRGRLLNGAIWTYPHDSGENHRRLHASCVELERRGRLRRRRDDDGAHVVWEVV